MKYKDFKNFLVEKTNVLEHISLKEHVILIDKDLNVYVNSNCILEKSDSLVKAKRYAYDYISKITEVYNEIPSNKLVNAIKEHHKVNKITNTLVEEYSNTIKNKTFTLDPIIEKFNISSISNKIEFVLEDKSVISINAKTLNILREHICDKYNTIEFMRQNKNNFLKIVKEIRDHHGSI